MAQARTSLTAPIRAIFRIEEAWSGTKNNFTLEYQSARATLTMITLGHLGTFDVENYGDLLYPLVFGQILKKYGAPVSVSQYSFLNGSALQSAGFETIALRSLFDPVLAQGPRRGSRAGVVVPPTRIVIGGGDILRTDRETV